MEEIDMQSDRATYCANCRYYYATEDYFVSNDFVSGERWGEFNGRKIKLPNIRLIGEGFPIEMCQHSNCFEIKEFVSRISGPSKTKTRVNGQGQFNKDLNCQFYEAPVWRLFFKKLFGR